MIACLQCVIYFILKITKARPVALKPRYWISAVILKASDSWLSLPASPWKSPPPPAPPLSLACFYKEHNSPLFSLIRHTLSLRVRLRVCGSPDQSVTRAAPCLSLGAAIRKGLSSTPVQHTSRCKRANCTSCPLSFQPAGIHSDEFKAIL